MRVGVVGLGIMGSAIARNLRNAGFAVAGFDIDPEKAAALAAIGGDACPDIATLATQSDALLTSLPGVAALDTVVAQLLAAPRPGLIIAELSTLGVADKTIAHDRLRAAGMVLLDCPLSGTGAQATIGDLDVYASGEAAAIAVLRPLLLGFARQVHDFGAFGNGSKAKLIANLLVAIHNVAAAEALTLGEKAGLDPAKLCAALASGAGGSRMLMARGPMMAARRYQPATMALKTWEKDLDLIEDFAAGLDAATPVFAACAGLYREIIKEGDNLRDTAAVAEWFKDKR